MDMLENISTLVDDYRSLLRNADASTESVEGVLIREGDWNPRAAEHLVRLARNYGSFIERGLKEHEFLRNFWI